MILPLRPLHLVIVLLVAAPVLFTTAPLAQTSRTIRAELDQSNENLRELRAVLERHREHLRRMQGENNFLLPLALIREGYVSQPGIHYVVLSKEKFAQHLAVEVLLGEMTSTEANDIARRVAASSSFLVDKLRKKIAQIEVRIREEVDLQSRLMDLLDEYEGRTEETAEEVVEEAVEDERCAPVAGFNCMVDHAVSLMNVGKVRGATAQECAEACRSDPKCRSFELYREKNNCNLNSVDSSHRRFREYEGYDYYE